MNLDLYSRYALSSSVRILTSVKLRLAKSILCLGPRRSEIRALCLSRLAVILSLRQSESELEKKGKRKKYSNHSLLSRKLDFILYILNKTIL